MADRAPRERATIRDVAQTAGVSIQTVSNVINGRHSQMRRSTLDRVEAAMAELDYYRNSNARSLRSSRQDAVAFLTLDEGHGFLADPMNGRILAGIGDQLRSTGVGLLIQSGIPDRDFEDLLRPLREGRADGAFLLLSGQPEKRRACIQAALDTGLPCVLIEEPDAPPPAVSVSTANRDGARRLTEYLIALGHTRISFAAARAGWAMVEQRLLGYLDALHEAGIAERDDLTRFAGSWEGAHAPTLVSELLARSEPPTAIICGNDLLAIGVMQALQQRGLRVPNDLAVAGFNDFDFSSLVSPPLTTVRTPGYMVGTLAAQRLLTMIEGQSVSTESLTLPAELVVRGST